MKTMKYALIFAALLALVSCKSKSDKQAEPPVEETAISIEIAEVTERQIEFPVRVSGFVISKNEAKPSFKVGGVIKRIFAEEGDVVYKGQLLATLNMTEINAQVAQAEEGLQKARRDLQRVRNLYADSVATLEQTQNAQTALRLAEETRAIAAFNQQYAEVRSPINGKVLQKILGEGEIAGPGMPVFYILGNNTNDWRIKVGVTDRDWARLVQNDRAEVRFDAFPGQVFKGGVSEIAQTVNPQSGTFDVELILSDKPQRLAAGLVAAVEIFPKTKGKSLLIPVDALIQGDEDRGVVYLIDDSLRAQKTYVSIQSITKEGVVLKNGLRAGDKVATVGGAYLEQGSKVSIIE